MAEQQKPIRLSGHGRDQLGFSGATEAEDIDAIRRAPWQPAELNGLECRQAYPFSAEWNGQHDAVKHARPIFVEAPDEIDGVTVCVYDCSEE